VAKEEFMQFFPSSLGKDLSSKVKRAEVFLEFLLIWKHQKSSASITDVIL